MYVCIHVYVSSITESKGLENLLKKCTWWGSHNVIIFICSFFHTNTNDFIKQKLFSEFGKITSHILHPRVSFTLFYSLVASWYFPCTYHNMYSPDINLFLDPIPMCMLYAFRQENL